MKLLACSTFSGTKAIDCSLLETDRKRSCVPHGPDECWLSCEGGGGGEFGPSWPHPWTPRQSSPPDLKDSVNMRFKWSTLWMGANESQRSLSAVQEKCVYLKHDES